MTAALALTAALTCACTTTTAIRPDELTRVAAAGNGRAPGPLIDAHGRAVAVRGYVNHATVERSDGKREMFSVPFEADLGPGYLAVRDKWDTRIYPFHTIRSVEVSTSEKYADMRALGYGLTTLGGLTLAASITTIVHFAQASGGDSALGMLVVSLPIGLSGLLLAGTGIPFIVSGHREPSTPRWFPAVRPHVMPPSVPGLPPPVPPPSPSTGPVGATLSWRF